MEMLSMSYYFIMTRSKSVSRSLYEVTKSVNLAKIILNTLKEQSEKLEKRVEVLKRENDELESGYSDMANFEEVVVSCIPVSLASSPLLILSCYLVMGFDFIDLFTGSKS